MGTETVHKTVYLVDMENIGQKMFCQHTRQHPEADYLVFYSDSTVMPGVILKQVAESLSIRFIDCRTGTNNAMDFCISAMAGRLTANGSKKVSILSNDKGYDPMIIMLQEQGIRIEREAVTQPADRPETEILKAGEQVPIIKAIRANVPKKYQNELIKVLPGAISRKEAHEMLQAILPEKQVSGIYKKLKKHIPQV